MPILASYKRRAISKIVSNLGAPYGLPVESVKLLSAFTVDLWPDMSAVAELALCEEGATSTTSGGCQGAIEEGGRGGDGMRWVSLIGSSCKKTTSGTYLSVM